MVVRICEPQSVRWRGGFRFIFFGCFLRFFAETRLDAGGWSDAAGERRWTMSQWTGGRKVATVQALSTVKPDVVFHLASR